MALPAGFVTPGDWNWPAIGTTIGILVNVIVLGIALWQGRVTARSAQTAAEAAKITEHAFELQKQEWEEGKRAHLRLLNMRRELIGSDVQIHLNFRNTGKSPAYWPQMASYQRSDHNTGSVGHPYTLMPEMEREFTGFWSPIPGYEVVDSIYWLKLVLTYEDRDDDHKIEVLYRFQDLLNPGSHSYALSRLRYDGVVIEEWVSDPGLEAGAEHYAELVEGQMLPPEDIWSKS